VASLHAFDIARGATPGYSVKQAITFGQPRVGNDEWFAAYVSLINPAYIPQVRCTYSQQEQQLQEHKC
jgi:hypothetical protein